MHYAIGDLHGQHGRHPLGLAWNAAWYRITKEERPCSFMEELIGTKVIRGHSITPSRLVECWDNDIINIDCGAKVLTTSLEDAEGEEDTWERFQASKLCGYCLEDGSATYVTRWELR